MRSLNAPSSDCSTNPPDPGIQPPVWVAGGAGSPADIARAGDDTTAAGGSDAPAPGAGGGGGPTGGGVIITGSVAAPAGAASKRTAIRPSRPANLPPMSVPPRHRGCGRGRRDAGAGPLRGLRGAGREEVAVQLLHDRFDRALA